MLHSFIESKLRSGLSAKYVCDIIIVFKSMAKYISKVHGFRNILADVVLPKVQKKEMELLTNDQQSLLCKYLIKNMNPTSLCILLSLYTGLRVGEVCGLMWGDIDFEKKYSYRQAHCSAYPHRCSRHTADSRRSQKAKRHSAPFRYLRFSWKYCGISAVMTAIIFCREQQKSLSHELYSTALKPF